VKFREENQEDAIFINSVSLGEVGSGATPIGLSSSEIACPAQEAIEPKKRSKKKHKLPKTKFSRIV